MRKFPPGLKLIDLTLRMFIEPVVDLDAGLLELHLAEIKERKESCWQRPRSKKKS